MFAEYDATLWGVWFIITMIIVQGFIATLAHRKQTNMIPGVLDDKLGHDSFVFRSHRTHQNSLENIIQMLTPTALAIYVGADATWLASIVWIYAIARLAHMVLYYVIATETNPSPRSYFYMIAYITNLVLVGFVATAMMS